MHQLEDQLAQLCQVDFRLDELVQREAFRIFKDTKPLLLSSINPGNEEHMVRSWNVCILYCALTLTRCSHGVGAGGVTLSELLKTTNLGIWDFFKELQQFFLKADSILKSTHREACEVIQKHAKELQANFVHLTVLFNYYKKNFTDYFSAGSFQRKASTSLAARGASCSHLQFGWMLFLALRMHTPSHFVDLVACTNSLIAVLVIMIIHMPAYLRKFSLGDTTFGIQSSKGVNILASLCHLYSASEVDVHAMVNQANRIICQTLQLTHDTSVDHSEQNVGIDTEGLTYFKGLMDEDTVACHLKSLDKKYEEVYHKQGGLDERMFLLEGNFAGGDSLSVSDETTSLSDRKRKHEMISSPLKTIDMKANVSYLSEPPTSSPMKATNHKMLPPTPVSATMTAEKWLHNVIDPLCAGPPPELVSYFKSCDTDITREVTYRAQVLLEAIFSHGRIRNLAAEEAKGLASVDKVWAAPRKLEAVKLYYKVLGAMCKAESQRLHSNNLSALLINERFHRCMLACSAELVLASHKTISMDFPVVLEPTGITAFDLSKVIESFVRHEETLPRELKRHLNSIEERLLEILAWEKGSSMYNSLIVARPQLQSEILRLGLLADPMSSLEDIKCHQQLLSGSSSTLLPRSKTEITADEVRGSLSPPRQVSTLPASESDAVLATSIPASPMGSMFLSPIRERSSAFSVFTPGKTRVLPPLQSAFASPQRPSPAGGGETCAETVIYVFFQKVLKLAAIRIKILCEMLQQPNNLMEEVHKLVQYILQQETQLFFNRHIDQIILCSIYGICKVKQLNLTFKTIVQHYKQNPQHKSHVFRTVFLELPATTTTGSGQGTGDIIQFYNDIFVPATKGFLMQLNTTPASSSGIMEEGDGAKGQLLGSPGPSPFSSLPDASPKKVSVSHNVYVSPLRSSKILSPYSRSLYACVGESTHAYQSPSKDLTDINKRLNNRRLGRLDFGSAGLVTDSVVAGTLCPQKSMQEDQLPHLTSDSVLSQSQTVSCSNCSPSFPSPSKGLCLNR